MKAKILTFVERSHGIKIIGKYKYIELKMVRVLSYAITMYLFVSIM